MASAARMVAVLALAWAVQAAWAADKREGVDPRALVPGANVTSFVQWTPGKEYRFHFVSKATHIESPLPDPSSVNPQTSLEDLGLFPFAVLEGMVTLQCRCRNPDDYSALFKATLSSVSSDCGPDGTRSGASCTRLNEVATALPAYPFWLSLTPEGEIVSIWFNSNDNNEIRGIKKNLVADLSLATPLQSENPKNFKRETTIGDTTYASTYHIRAFTQQAHLGDNAPVSGLMVNKEKVITRTVPAAPSAKGRQTPAEPTTEVRNTWAYMVVGGSIENDVPAPVPTHLASIEQVKVDPSRLLPALKTLNVNLWILSRLTLDLRTLGTTELVLPCRIVEDGYEPDGMGAKLPTKTEGQVSFLETAPGSVYVQDRNVRDNEGYTSLVSDLLGSTVQALLETSARNW